MERELWTLLYQHLRALAARTRDRGCQHPTWVIAAILLWAALHDRPIRWACDPGNWAATRLRPARWPSEATVSRRLRRPEFLAFRTALEDRLRGDGPPAWTLIVDGKALPIARHSTDPDARSGVRDRGYKLHVIWGERAFPDQWRVTPLNRYEGAVAEEMLAGIRGKGFLLADGNFEANRVYDAAARAGYQLLAPFDPQDTGRGHQYQSPHRLAALQLMRDGLGQVLLRGRSAIERWFGNLTSFGSGLGPLPSWVRRQGRVERWVWAKLSINAARILHRHQPFQPMQ
jgi:hypothetical protein